MNLRGTFITDGGGRVAFRTVKPAGYPVPVNGPVGALLRAQGRHNLRPAHIHFLIRKPGFKTQFSQVYSSDDPNLETDVQFGVTRALVAHYVRHERRRRAGTRCGRAVVHARTPLRARARRAAAAAGADQRQDAGAEAGVDGDRAAMSAGREGATAGATRYRLRPSKESASAPRSAATQSTGTFGAVSPLPGPCSFGRAMCAGAQPALRGMAEIVAVRRDHHAVARRQVERLAGGEIDPRLRLEVAARSRSRGSRPRESCCGARDRPSARCCRSTPARAGTAVLSRARPGGTSGQASSRCQARLRCAHRLFGQAGDLEARQDAVEVAPVQHVELAERRCGRSGPPPSPAGIRRARRRRRRASRANGRAA